MRLTANQALTRIDSFIKLPLGARCFPLQSPGDSRASRRQPWKGCGCKRREKEERLQAFRVDLRSKPQGNLSSRSNKRPWKDPNSGKDWRQEVKGMIEDEMVGWHHQLNGHEFEQTVWNSEGQGSLACCSPWGHKESDPTEQLNDNNKRMEVRCTGQSMWEGCRMSNLSPGEPFS